MEISGGKLKITSSGYGWIYANDTNHSIIKRGDRNGAAADYTNYYQYGGTLANGVGHKFWTGGVLASQTLKMQIADDGTYIAGPLLPTGGIIGSTINYTTSQGWAAANPSSSQIGYFGSNFTNNGATENKTTYAVTPYLSPGLTWASINDAASDDDGGWNKGITGLVSTKTYRSMVWVRRTNASTNGNFYFGCDGGNTLDLSNAVATNPYFFATVIGTLTTTNRWYLAVGYIHAYADGSTTSYGKIYDSITGQSILNGTDFKMVNGATAQTHRTYLYYSTDTNSNLEWWGPRFEEVNGNEPTIGSMLAGSITTPTYSGGVSAPIYYDSDNTAFYGDFASTSNINILAGNGKTALETADTYLRINQSSAFSNGVWFGTSNRLSSTGYGAWGSNGGTTTSRVWIEGGTYNGSTVISLNGSTGDITSSAIIYALTSSRSPIFYDYNDTTYYIDPASTANTALKVRGGAIFGPNTSWGASLYVGTNGNVSGTATVAASNGNIHIDTAGAGYPLYLQYYNGGYTEAHQSMRSPIFYDNNDTSYYGDFASTSNINAINIAGKITQSGPGRTTTVSTTNYDARIGSSDLYLYFKSIDGGAYPCVIQLFRVSDAATSWPIALQPAGGNTSIGTYSDLGQKLGISGTGYATGDFRAPIFYDSNDTSYYGDFASDSRINSVYFTRWRINSSTSDLANDAPWYGYGLSNIAGSIGYYQGQLAHYHGLRLRAHASIMEIDGNSFGSSWIWANTNFAVAGQNRGTVFYDYSDTTYYGDFNSDSNWQGLTVRGKAQTGLTGQSNWKRPNITGDSNYWNGAMGWGTENFDTVFSWGNGFFDTWSSPANQPAGTSHWNGYNAGHHASYGYQVTVGAGDPSLYYIRGRWGGGFSQWYKIAIYENNGQAARAFYASIYYDSNNTGYYGDFASTSKFNTVQIDYINQNVNFQGQIIYDVNQIHASILYHRNNTGFYVQPASTSNISTLYVNNGWTYVANNYGYGVVGLYTHTIFQLVFAMGDSYKTTAGGGINNLYGMAWSYPSAGGIAGNLDSHGMIVAINGGFGSCMSYSIVAAGNVTAYSDERLKTNWSAMPENFVERLAQVRVGTYTRIDGERIRQVGVSAQSLRPLLPEAVIEATDDFRTLSVSYGNAAMASAVELAKEVVSLKEQMVVLMDRLNKLENK